MTSNGTSQYRDNRVVRAARFVTSTFEFAALAAARLVVAGGKGVKRLIGSKKRVEKVKAKPDVSIATSSDKKSTSDKKLAVEERLELLEKRLLALEKGGTGHAILGKGKVAVEAERHHLLVELARITKSFINQSDRK